MSTVVPAVEQPIVRPVMPELDAVRGVAILLVFWFHGFMLFTPPSEAVPAWERAFLEGARQGGAGVNLFFVLSGFLITGILLDSVRRPDYYSRFYYRRALRILPAYYLLLLILAGLGWVTFVHRHNSWAFLGLSFIYLSNVTPLFGVPMQYGPLWSLAVEEHFYLLWPAAVRALTKRALIVTASLICLVEPFLRTYAFHRGGLWWGRYTWLEADGLALGALLAVWARSTYATRANLLKLSGLSATFAAAGLAASLMVPRAAGVGLRTTVVNYFALAVVSAVLWAGTGQYRALVNLRLLSFFGYISYGLYLMHMLSLNLYDDVARQVAPSLLVGTSFGKCCFRLLVALTLATGVAYLSRITYEEFFLRMKNKPHSERDGLRAVAAAQPALRS
jgi:peptidoglycan/LPS O-acetylase OafA/YrhL